jgi:hypothetical protein
MTVLTREEQRRRDVAAASDARMERLRRLNAAENAVARSAALADELERRRLARESAERRARLRAYEAQTPGRVVLSEERTPAARRVVLASRRTSCGGRPVIEEDVLLNGRRVTERWYADG